MEVDFNAWAATLRGMRPDLAAKAARAQRVSVALVGSLLGQCHVLTALAVGPPTLISRDVESGGDPLAAIARAIAAQVRVLLTPEQFAASLVDWLVVPPFGLVVAVHVVGWPETRCLLPLTAAIESGIETAAVATWLTKRVSHDMMMTKATHFVHLMAV